MIRKDELIMEKNKKFTIEELEKSYQEHQAEADALKQKIAKMKKEAEEKKKAQLALEKENRKKEVDEAYENYNTLLKAYIEDYGTYSITTSSNDSTWFPAWWTRF